MSLQALRQDLHIYQGASWDFTYTKYDSDGDVVDLTGYSAVLGIKDNYNGVLETFLSTESTEYGTITLGGTAGTVMLAMTADQTGELAGELNALTALIIHDGDSLSSAYVWIDQSQPTATYRYDLKLYSGDGVVTREIEGFLIVHRQITTFGVS